MKTYTKEELKEILELHRKWCDSEDGGARAYLGDAYLRDAYLGGAYLGGAYLGGADLGGVDLRGAYLRDAYLGGADLGGADLGGADLGGANLGGADLGGANLGGYQIPQEGDLTVWKKGANGLIKLCIPDGAKRTASLIGRKCRAESARVLWTETGEPMPGRRDGTLIYTPGEMVYPDSYDDDPRVECTHGIHFFLTREEAEAWN